MNAEPFFSTSILLASQSPRRKMILTSSGFHVEPVKIEVEEDFHADLKAGEIPEYLAEKKSQAYSETIPDNSLLVTADTVVWLDGEVLNKPADTAEAASMLRKLSGRMHTVFTGVCMRNNTGLKVFSEASHVYFQELSEEMISYYLKNYLPLDKAGSYGIQEFIGYVGIRKIDGCYYNVMGFPVSRFITEMNTF